MVRLRKKKPGFFEQLVIDQQIIPLDNRQKGLQFLVDFFNQVRPDGSRGRKNAEKNLEEATAYLQKEKLVLANFQHAVYSLLRSSRLTNALTESGIPLARGFWQELMNRIKHKLLPPLQDENDFLYVLQSVFFRKNDFAWVEAISRQAWIEFFEAAGFRFGNTDPSGIATELVNALRILSYQVAQLGLEKEVINYLPEEDRYKDTAFVKQNYKVHELEKLLEDNAGNEDKATVCSHLKNIIEDCYLQIEHIRNGHSDRGASLHQTYLLLILTNRLQRMQLILDILDADQDFDTGRFVDIFRMLVRNEKRKNSIREFLSQGVGYLAYQIAEHKGEKGEKYITISRKEYFRMIRSAMWGGFIISFIAIFKNLLGKLKLAPFPMGMLYSINYSFGFLLIEHTGSTLATKQPAFTASAVASSLDTRKMEGEPDLQGLAETVANVSRSQLASFFGNLVIVFPLTFIFAWLYQELTGKAITDGEAAFNLLKDQHPWRSKALIYACFTGVFLFLSGIIAGYWQNKIRYGQIRERMQQHPALKFTMSPKRLERISGFIERNLGSIIGNIALGFFLGFAGILGKILGLPFDIRHITISAGNASIGMFGMGISNIPPYFLLAVIGGVLCIGFLNFLVSFSLAFLMAVRSRGIHLSQYPRLFRIIGRHFFTHTRDFFFAPRRPRIPVYKPLTEPSEKEQGDR